MADLDLSTGDPTRADEETPTARRRRRRATQAEESARTEPRTEAEIRAGLKQAFEKLAQNRYAKDDQELGDAISEEGAAMTEGFVTLTDNTPFLRQPFLIILNIVIILLAFGRVGSILIERVQERRAVRAAQRQAEADYNNGVPVVEVP